MYTNLKRIVGIHNIATKNMSSRIKNRFLCHMDTLSTYKGLTINHLMKHLFSNQGLILIFLRISLRIMNKFRESIKKYKSLDRKSICSF
jgi:hypothetical protein